MKLEFLRNINSCKSKNVQRKIDEKQRTKEINFYC